MTHEDVLNILRRSAIELRELDIGLAVPRHSAQSLTSLQFQQLYVSRNKPVVLTDAIEHWPALQSWSAEYLLDRVGDVEITVAATPNGRADAVTEHDGGRVFALPYEQRMTVRTFLEGLRDSRMERVLYAQRQSDSLAEEFSALLPDIGSMPAVAEAFGCPPEALNLWIGDHRSVSSFHKDPYENLE
ncbi:hypothetical protein WJX81_007108 [Elliptochloris bilobata]|uniref:Cupin-like domain-containing protein n=1 Tax=Elliptochloris bilobata TaxID=381761 RepID=A0AAW1RBP3_9CHLO